MRNMTPQILQTPDITGGTFHIITLALLASGVLFLGATFWVQPKWKLPLALIGLVALIAGGNYLHMRDIWVASQQTPVIYRYVDWMLTIPIQTIVMYLFMSTVAAATTGLFWRLVVVSVVMMIASYLGAAGFMNATLGFLIWMAGWLYILGEVYFGRLGEINATKASEDLRLSYFWLRLIITIGWALYPLCYFIEYFAGGANLAGLNAAYNLADFLNKITFGLIVLHAAMRDGATAR